MRVPRTQISPELLGLQGSIQNNHVYRRPRSDALEFPLGRRQSKNLEDGVAEMPEDHHFHLGINQEKWLWRYTTLKGSADGWTDYSKKKVLLDRRAKHRTRLELELHEGLHSTLGPAISEEAVTAAASDLAKILWSLGYRLQSKDKPQ